MPEYHADDLYLIRGLDDISAAIEAVRDELAKANTASLPDRCTRHFNAQSEYQTFRMKLDPLAVHWWHQYSKMVETAKAAGTPPPEF